MIATTFLGLDCMGSDDILSIDHPRRVANTLVCYVALWTRLAKAQLLGTPTEPTSHGKLLHPISGLIATGQRCLSLSRYVPWIFAQALSHHLSIQFHPSYLRRLRVQADLPSPPPRGHAIKGKSLFIISPTNFAQHLPEALQKARPTRENTNTTITAPLQMYNYRSHQAIPVDLGIFTITFIGLCGQRSFSKLNNTYVMNIMSGVLGPGAAHALHFTMFELAYKKPLGVASIKNNIPHRSITENTTEAGAESDVSENDSLTYFITDSGSANLLPSPSDSLTNAEDCILTNEMALALATALITSILSTNKHSTHPTSRIGIYLRCAHRLLRLGQKDLMIMSECNIAVEYIHKKISQIGSVMPYTNPEVLIELWTLRGSWREAIGNVEYGNLDYMHAVCALEELWGDPRKRGMRMHPFGLFLIWKLGMAVYIDSDVRSIDKYADVFRSIKLVWPDCPFPWGPPIGPLSQSKNGESVAIDEMTKSRISLKNEMPILDVLEKWWDCMSPMNSVSGVLLSKEDSGDVFEKDGWDMTGICMKLQSVAQGTVFTFGTNECGVLGVGCIASSTPLHSLPSAKSLHFGGEQQKSMRKYAPNRVTEDALARGCDIWWSGRPVRVRFHFRMKLFFLGALSMLLLARDASGNAAWGHWSACVGLAYQPVLVHVREEGPGPICRQVLAASF